MTKHLSIAALGIAGFILLSMPMFVLATHTGDPNEKYTIEAVMGKAISDDADCVGIPGAKFKTGHDTSCWLPGAGGATTIGGALQLVNRLTNWMVTILVLFGIFYGIIGAFQFLTSAGEEKKLETGKKKIYYAIGGVVLGLLVKGIITLLVNFVGTL